ncbi:MAG: hypothetical protein AABW75_02415 [Nanoarchaeota archaeon]
MEAHSNLDYKINVALSEKEFSQLESGVLEGKLIFKSRVNGKNNILAEKDLQLSLGPLVGNSEHVFIEMLTSPKAKNKEYERVAFYFIRISNEGYNVMRKAGRIEEKNDLGGRIEIYRKEVFVE